jgi:Tol biopolymer transport system component/tRNA A-37 threonylcarbamoyl transferase component Bud32
LSSLPADPESPPGLADDLIGQTITHYRILEPIGEGAMGVVYKAQDTWLERTVALKLLPQESTRKPRAKARFLQEAKAASALDHPNICTVYEAGDTGDGRLYLAMAYYDGETLRQRLARGRLPVAEALDVARQIAQGLAKAHRSGIVHRDIKPANLMITSDGIVKILDFGIAKLWHTAGLTIAGSLLGTPAYMSPEQARRGEVGPPADVWALGVVFYEMLTGTRPFIGGEEPMALVYALVHDEPEPLSRLRSGVPAEIERIISRMLAKSPADRYPTAAEAASDLAALQAALGTGQSITAETLGGALAPWPRRRRGLVWLAAGLALVLGLVIGVFLLRRPGASDAASSRLSPPPVFARLTDQDGREAFPSLSPEGDFFVYAKAQGGQMDLFLQRVDGGKPIDLTPDSPVDDVQPAFSPDGRQIAFRSERDGGGVFVMGSTGESVRRVTDFGFSPAWSPDGKELLVAMEGITDPWVRRLSNSKIFRVNIATGEKRVVVAGDGVQPSWSPHGWRIAYWGLPGGTGKRVVWTIPATGGKPVPATGDTDVNWNPVWSPDGRYLYFSSDHSGSMNLWRVRIDERTGEVSGDPEPITTPSPSSGFMSFSKDGHKIVYAIDDSRSVLETVGFDADRERTLGALAPVAAGSRAVHSCAISPDGRWIAFYASAPGEDLFVMRRDGSDIRRLTEDAFKDLYPSWSPDGQWLLFYSNRGGKFEAWAIRPDGRDRRPVTSTRGPLVYPVWSPDGTRIAAGILGLDPIVVRVDSADGSPRASALVPMPSPATVGEAFYPSSWSADGRKLAGNMSRVDKSLLTGFGIYSFDTMSFERLSREGVNPVWLHDSRRLIYLEQAGVFIFDVQAKRSRRILETPESSTFEALSLSPDEKSLCLIRVADEGDIGMVKLN